MARIVVHGGAYHVTHRGNRKEAVFFDDSDRESYRQGLRSDSELLGVEIWAYCLMTNHVHLVVTSPEPDSLGKIIGRAHRRHACRINKRHGWSGHLWANRFHSSLLDEIHLRNAIRYVELNPVRAGLVARAEDYPWSSAPSHCDGAEDPLLSRRRITLAGGASWSAWLAEGLSDADLASIRGNTSTGRPTAAPEAIRWLERHLGRTIQPRRRN